VAGSTPFLIEDSENFNRAFKKLAKAYKTTNTFVDCVEKILEDLIEDPNPTNSWNEPLPSKINLPEGWTFHKLKFKVSQGASGQIRLMYLVNATTHIIKLVSIYSHEQFAKRPANQDLKSVISGILDC
jgi:mRNA-degrading endonuclease RelE of RelBE toxin-antitoxin system